jgi:hypothetical protein
MSVYFITCRKTGMVKIGSAYDPFERLKQLQTGSPTKLKIEALLKGACKREREIHKLLAKHRVHGEWFRICPAIEAIIKEVAKPTRVRLLAEKRRGGVDLGALDEDSAPIRRPYAGPVVGFPDTLPPPRVTPAFDERCLSREQRKRIASGDITFPFRATVDA